MLPNLNLSILAKYGLKGAIPANQRVDQIDSAISKLNGVETTSKVSFSDILPNIQNNEPVRLLDPQKLIELIQTNSKKFNVDPKLINAVIKQESGYNLNAKSPQGALGLMQLMPETARSLGVIDPTDPAQNVEGGTKYLSQLLKQYRGNVILSLAAYNAGPGNVANHSGVPPYKETKEYIFNVLKTYSSSLANA
ncbi:MAG: lytic transglycosylase domain-containing protein [Cyanobacteriota bacterium]